MEERNYLMTIYGRECGDYLYLTSLYGQAGVRFMMKSNGQSNDFVVTSKDELMSIAKFLWQHCNADEQECETTHTPEGRPRSGGEERAEISEVNGWSR